MSNNNSRSFFVVVAVLILFSGTISFKAQYANAGLNGNQFDSFGQGEDSSSGQAQQDEEQFRPNIPSEEGLGLENSGSQDPGIYENPLYSLKIPYPSDWFVDDTEEGKVEFAPQIGEDPSIKVTILPDPKSDASASMKESIKKVMVSAGDTIVDEEQSTIKGQDAYFISWTGKTDTGDTFKNAAIVTQTTDFLYIFQLGTPIEDFGNTAGILNAMVQGAEFSETGSNSQRPSNSLGGGGGGGITANNDTFQEGQGLQDGRGSGSGINGDQSDPFGQGGDSLGSGDESFGTESLGLNPQNFGNDSSAGFESYTDPRYGFSVKYPADWDPNTNFVQGAGERNVTAVFSTRNEEGTMYMFVGLNNSTDAKNLALQDYSEMYINTLVTPNPSNIGKFPAEIVARFPHSIGNADGYMVIYNTPLIGVTEKTAEAWTKLDNQGYIHLEFVASPSSAYEGYENIATQMLESFQP